MGHVSVEIPDDTLLAEREIVITASVKSMGNSGIGAYECHGYRGYDRGVDFVEEFEIDGIEVDGVDVPFSRSKVSRWHRLSEMVFDNAALCERITEALGEAQSEADDDGPDYEPDEEE